MGKSQAGCRSHKINMALACKDFYTKFLYSCGGGDPPCCELYVQVDSMGEALVSIEHLNKACLHVQRLFRGRVGRNIAKNMRARVFLSRASMIILLIEVASVTVRM